MLAPRISAVFLLAAFVFFAVGSYFSLPPKASGWDIESYQPGDLIRGITTTEIDHQLDKKLAYKDAAVKLWGSINYGLFHSASKGVALGRDDWLFTAEEFETTPQSADRIEKNTAEIRDTIARLQQHGIAVVMAWIPAKSRLFSDKLGNLKRPELQQNLTPPGGLPLVDGREVFAALPEPAFMRTDTHWSPAAAKAMAAAIQQYVLAQYPDLQLASKSYRTTESDDAHDYSGDLLKFIPVFHDNNPLPTPQGETVKTYQTEAAGGDADAGLFGDEAIDVTLVGTSYSAQKDWHFEGFLKEALQADVLNLADEGRGPFAPMREFLKRLDAGETTAKLVIWEFPERYLPRDADEPEKPKEKS